MKTILAILFLSVLGVYHADAQTATSSKKNGQAQQSQESTLPVSNNASSGTLVSGGKEATVKEVPLENKENTESTVPLSNGATSSSKKPE
ncbi:MAG: hypothetical protein V4506_03705 [Bacteroidota bacterium]